jgi:alpha-amylase
LTDRFARNDGQRTQCSNLGNYCGGGYRGIINNLDYIQGMGFDAIWISPIV